MAISPELQDKIMGILGQREMASARQMAAELGIPEFKDAAETQWSQAFIDLADTLDHARLGGQTRLNIDPQAAAWHSGTGVGPDTFVYSTPDQAAELVATGRVQLGERLQMGYKYSPR